MMGFKSLNDEFAEYHVFKSKQLEIIDTAPGHLKMDVMQCDEIISRAINQASISMMRITSAYESGFMNGKEQCTVEDE